MAEKNNILLDTNFIIYSAQLKYKKVREWLRLRDSRISGISKVEILPYHTLSDNDRVYFESVFDISQLLPRTMAHLNLAISLRQKKSMGLRASLIAATAHNANMPPASANTVDFRHFGELEMIDPVAS